MAGSSTVQETVRGTARLQVFDITYTADDATGAIDALTIAGVRDGLLVYWEHNPGATAATTAFDIVLNNENDVDALCGGALDIDTSANACGGPIPNGSNITPVPVYGTLDFVATGNTQNSATGVFTFSVITL